MPRLRKMTELVRAIGVVYDGPPSSEMTYANLKS